MNSQVSAQFDKPQRSLKFMLLSCTVVPCIEELLFTYLPARYNIYPSISAGAFGLCHYNPNSYHNMICSAAGNYIRRRYLLGRNGKKDPFNLTPIYAHSFNNILASLICIL